MHWISFIHDSLLYSCILTRRFFASARSLDVQSVNCMSPSALTSRSRVALRTPSHATGTQNASDSRDRADPNLYWQRICAPCGFQSTTPTIGVVGSCLCSRCRNARVPTSG